MVFPATILDVRTELLLSGTWTDISAKALPQGSGCSITRGLPDETGQAQPSQMTMTLNNADGRFSPRNPAGPYYGSLGRNTQIRVSVPEGASYLRLQVPNQFGFASTPDSVGLSVTTSTEIQADVTLDNWNANQVLCSKWTSGGNQRSWILVVNEDATLTCSFSPDGSTIKTGTSTVPVTIPPLGRMAIKATINTTTGSVAFFTAPTIGGTYTQLGQFRGTGGATSIFDSTAPVRVGAPGTSANADFPNHTGVYGKVHAFNLLNGIGGSAVASPDWTVQTAGASTFNDAQGNTWSMTGSPEISDRKYRFHGEVAEWPITWDMSGRAVFTAITANGVMRRLGHHKVTGSPMRRYWTMTPSVTPVAYWPLEDGSKAKGFASGLAGGKAMELAFGSATQFGVNSDFVCSDPLPVLNGAWKGVVPSYTAGSGHQLLALIEVPAGGDTDQSILLEYKTNSPDIGTVLLRYATALSGTIAIETYSPDNVALGSVPPGSDPSYVGCNGQLLLVGMACTTGVVTLNVAQVGATSATTDTDTLSASTLGRITAAYLNYELSLATKTAAGHVAVIPDASTAAFNAVLNALNAYAGEAAGARFSRLCSEEDVVFRSQGRLSTSMPMGPQPAGKLMDLLQECADADHGFITEPRQVFAIGYRTRASLYHQSPAAALTYTSGGQGQVSDLQPTDDDQYISNDVTVSLPDGSFARQTQATGPLSTLDPPNGVGVYDTSVTLNLAYESSLDDAAGWLLHLGTINEPRYQNTMLHLARSNLTSLLPSLQETDIGDRYTVAGTPVWLPPDGISQIIRQYSEQFGTRMWDISWQGIPESAYETVVFDDPVLGKFDTDGSTLSSGVTSTGQSLSLASSGALWTTNLTAGWSFTVSGTPGDATHFIVTTAQAASISVGDIFLDTTNPTQAFKVTAISVPFAGFVNISFTPNAGSNMNNPDVVTQSLGDFPFDIGIAGERITVAKITGASSPQTANVVRSVNGVVKAQSSGAAVALFVTPVIAL